MSQEQVRSFFWIRFVLFMVVFNLYPFRSRLAPLFVLSADTSKDTDFTTSEKMLCVAVTLKRQWSDGRLRTVVGIDINILPTQIAGPISALLAAGLEINDDLDIFLLQKLFNLALVYLDRVAVLQHRHAAFS